MEGEDGAGRVRVRVRGRVSVRLCVATGSTFIPGPGLRTIARGPNHGCERERGIESECVVGTAILGSTCAGAEPGRGGPNQGCEMVEAACGVCVCV